MFGTRFRTYFDEHNRTVIKSYDIDITMQNAFPASYYCVSPWLQVTGSFMLTL